jgi:hypothetical protein
MVRLIERIYQFSRYCNLLSEIRLRYFDITENKNQNQYNDFYYHSSGGPLYRV